MRNGNLRLTVRSWRGRAGVGANFSDLSRLAVTNFCNCFFQAVNIFLGYLPYCVQVDTHIIVDQNVAHTRNSAPGVSGFMAQRL